MALKDLVNVSSWPWGSCVTTSPCDDQRKFFAGAASERQSAIQSSRVLMRGIVAVHEPLALDSHPLLRPGGPFRGGDDGVGRHVQDARHLQHRHRAVHELALPAVGREADLVAARRHVRDQAHLDPRDAARDRRLAGAGGAHAADGAFLPDVARGPVAARLRLGDPRHRRRRLLHAGARAAPAGGLRRREERLLPRGDDHEPGRPRLSRGHARRFHGQRGAGVVDRVRRRGNVVPGALRMAPIRAAGARGRPRRRARDAGARIRVELRTVLPQERNRPDTGFPDAVPLRGGAGAEAHPAIPAGSARRGGPGAFDQRGGDRLRDDRRHCAHRGRNPGWGGHRPRWIAPLALAHGGRDARAQPRLRIPRVRAAREPRHDLRGTGDRAIRIRLRLLRLPPLHGHGGRRPHPDGALRHLHGLHGSRYDASRHGERLDPGAARLRELLRLGVSRNNSLLRRGSVGPYRSFVRQAASQRTRLTMQRLASLDAFRGFAIASMMLVNNPGDWGHLHAPLAHAKWNGWTFTDLVFPFFLFAAGLSMAISVDRRTRDATAPPQLVKELARRAAVIFLVGLALNVFPAFDFSTVRIPGVLQRIALCVLVAAALAVRGSSKAIGVWIAVLLAAYTLPMLLVPVPGPDSIVAAGALEPGRDFGAWVDRHVFGGHLWSQSRTLDPEGLVSTLPAVCRLLFRVLAGRWLLAARAGLSTTAAMFAAGIGALLARLVLHAVLMAVHQNLWTPVYFLV